MGSQRAIVINMLGALEGRGHYLNMYIVLTKCIVRGLWPCWSAQACGYSS